MKKDERIGVRVPSELKRELARIAGTEGRTLAQVCEILLKAGVSEYHRRGTKFMQQFAAGPPNGKESDKD